MSNLDVPRYHSHFMFEVSSSGQSITLHKECEKERTCQITPTSREKHLEEIEFTRDTIDQRKLEETSELRRVEKRFRLENEIKEM